MSIIPAYSPPDFAAPNLANAPIVRVEPAPADGVVPGQFHGTSNHPEYLHLGKGRWLLVPESRMDTVLVLKEDVVEAMEARRIRKGDPIVIGRTENGEEGIYIHIDGFEQSVSEAVDKFSFRTRGTRETPFSLTLSMPFLAPEMLVYPSERSSCSPLAAKSWK